MKKYYLRNNFPIKTNCPMPDDLEISEQEYKQICKERNDKIAEVQAEQEEEMRPVQERNKKIWERALKNAEKELKAEGKI